MPCLACLGETESEGKLCAKCKVKYGNGRGRPDWLVFLEEDIKAERKFWNLVRKYEIVIREGYDIDDFIDFHGGGTSHTVAKFPPGDDRRR